MSAIWRKNKNPTAMPKRKITPVRVLAEEAPDAIEGPAMISRACILYTAVNCCYRLLSKHYVKHVRSH